MYMSLPFPYVEPLNRQTYILEAAEYDSFQELADASLLKCQIWSGLASAIAEAIVWVAAEELCFSRLLP